MFNRVVNYLPENEVNLVKTSTEIEKLNLLTEDFDDNNMSEEHRNSLKSTITQLNNNNFNLKIQLERLKESNRKELENLNQFENQDRQKIMNEMNQMKALHSRELKNHAKTQSEMKKELENLKVRIEMEQNQKEELKNRYMIEFNAVKVRFENEINKQNKLMQNKYDDLIKEIKRLNDVIKQLKLEKDELKVQIQREKEISRQIVEQKEATSTPKLDKRYFIILINIYERVWDMSKKRKSVRFFINFAPFCTFL
jgi:hypothetical protein